MTDPIITPVDDWSINMLNREEDKKLLDQQVEEWTALAQKGKLRIVLDQFYN
jgi:hypothetical protein